MATRWPSVRPVIPARSSAEACTKISLPPPSEAMKPNPFMALYHLTVPDSSTAARSACGYIGRSGRGRLGGSCCAELLSTLRISLTWGPLGPGPARTSSVAPGGTLLWPLRSTTLTCKKASPDPLASCTKPNPLSALYHLTTAWTGGPVRGFGRCPVGGGCRAGKTLQSQGLRDPQLLCRRGNLRASAADPGRGDGRRQSIPQALGIRC